MVSYNEVSLQWRINQCVLILVVVDDGLVRKDAGLNELNADGLNPCCSGRWSRTKNIGSKGTKNRKVLILVVVDDGLVLNKMIIVTQAQLSLNPCCSGRWSRTCQLANNQCQVMCLNPCCSGRWSRTRPYKTLLIINKLKNFTKQIFTFLNRKLTIS